MGKSDNQLECRYSDLYTYSTAGGRVMIKDESWQSNKVSKRLNRGMPDNDYSPHHRWASIREGAKIEFGFRAAQSITARLLPRRPFREPSGSRDNHRYLK